MAGAPPTDNGDVRNSFEDYASAPQLFHSHLISFLAEGVFDAYPNLRLCLLESGVTWLPSLVWKLDTSWKELRREIPWVRERPTEYVRRHVRLTVQPLDGPEVPSQMAEVVEQLGSDEMLLFA